MVIPTTSIAFIILSIGLLVFGWMFLRAFKKQNTSPTDKKIGFLLSSYFIGFAINTGIIIGLGTFLFAQSPIGLFFVLIIANIGLTLLGVLSVYTIYYIFFPRHSSLLMTLFVLALGIAAFVLAIIIHPQPFLTSQNGIDWGMPFSISLITFYLLFISVGATTYIFGRLFQQVKSKELKALSLILAIVGVIGVLSAFMGFVALHNVSADFRTRIYDIGQGIIGVAAIIGFIVLLILRARFSKNKVEKEIGPEN